MQINVAVTDANNIVCTVVPPQVQTITIDRGVAGNGIVSIVPVTISTFQYLRITYTNGTVSDVGPLTSTAYTATAPIEIIGNTISLLTVPIAVGGTGATTAAAAIQNLLPSYTGNGNKRLGLNSGATALEWVADGGGTVTSVDVSGGSTGLTTSGGPITGSGTITLAGTLAIANGGSGQTTAQAAMNAFAGAVTSGSYLRGNGTNVVMSGIQAGDVPTLNQNTTGTAANITATTNSTLITLSSLSLPGSQVTGNISGNAANVTGIVAIANGGTGQTTANAALNALLPVQTGNATKYLQTDGTNATWDAINLSTADITGVLPTANGGTGLSAFTANRVFYASSTSAIAQSANLTFDGTTLQAESNANFAVTSGAVGIGTASPGFKLDVNGTLRLQGFGASSAGYLVLGTSASETIYGGGTGGVNNVITFSTNNQGALSLSGNGNVNILRTGARITGDFSNATVANRVAFQTSTVNGRTHIGLLPNGTEVRSDVILYNSSDTVNNSFLDIFCSDTQYAFSGNKGGTGTYLPMTFYTGGSERVRIQTSGNVGIGTNLPAERLHILSAGTDVGIIQLGGTATTGYYSQVNQTTNNLQLIANGDQAYRVSVGTNNGTGNIRFFTAEGTTGNTERMCILANGNVGIGSVSPGSILELNKAASGSIGPNLFIENGAASATGNASRISFGIDVGSSAASPTAYIENVKDSAGAGSSYLAFGTFGSSLAERVRITGAGFVGIGTNNPLNRLHVANGQLLIGAAGGEGGELQLQNNAGNAVAAFIDVDGGNDLRVFNALATSTVFMTSSAERMRINASGNVGIGTSSYSQKLAINSANTSTNSLVEYKQGDVTYGYTGLGQTNKMALQGSVEVVVQTTTATPITFLTNGAERMRIDSSGNVGIGTTTTSNGNLTVQQSSATTGGPVLTLWNSNPSGGNTCGYLRFFSNTTVRAQIHSVVDSGSPFHGNLIFSTGENTLSERLRIDYLGNLSSAGGQYRTRYYQTNSFIPNSTNWIRLCTLPGTNQGQTVEFIFVIPGQHIQFRVKFSKTTAGGLGGGGVLEVELLGTFSYYNYCPFDWRLTDQGTNLPSHIDIRFPSNAGETIGSRINVISSYSADAPSHATFPMTNLGSGTTGGSYSNMGSAGAGGFTKQWFRMTGSKYVFYDNNMAITSGATPPTA